MKEKYGQVFGKKADWRNRGLFTAIGKAAQKGRKTGHADQSEIAGETGIGGGGAGKEDPFSSREGICRPWEAKSIHGKKTPREQEKKTSSSLSTTKKEKEGGAFCKA